LGGGGEAGEVLAIQEVLDGQVDGQLSGKLLANHALDGGVAGEELGVAIVLELERRRAEAGGGGGLAPVPGELARALVASDLGDARTDGEAGVNEEIRAVPAEVAELVAEVYFDAAV